MKKIKPSLKQRLSYQSIKNYLKPEIKKMYSFSVPPFDLKGPFLIVSSKVTSVDQFIIMLSFSQYIYFMYNENIYRNDPENAKKQEIFGNIPYKLASPISWYKDKVLKLLHDGNNVCVYPELYTNYDGVTSPIDKEIGALVKEAGCTLVTYCFTGGYLTEPAWAKNKRKGWINGHIVNVYSKYDLERLEPDKITKMIERDLDEDAYARQCNSPIKYPGEGLAEGIENIYYTCVNCGAIDSYEAKGNDYHCTKCEARGSYTDQGLTHANFRFKTVTDYLAWEEMQIERMADSEIDYNEENVQAFTINDDHTLTKVLEGKMHVDKKGITIASQLFEFADILKMDVDDKATSLVFSYGDKTYKVTKDNFKPLKYRKLFYKRKASIETYGNK